MRLLTFSTGSALGTLSRVGVGLGNSIILDANLGYAFMLAERDQHPCAQDLADVLVPPDMMKLINNLHFGSEAISETLAYLGERAKSSDLKGLKGEKLIYKKDEVSLLAPLLQPRSIRDVVGFMQHIRNCGDGNFPQGYVNVPAVYYKGNVMSVIGPDVDVQWPPFSERLDFELELGAVIGKQGVNISEEDAMGHIFGYTIFNDVSARSQQLFEMAGGLGPTKGKDFDTGNILGPVLVTADEFSPLDGHDMIARVNGEEWGRGKIGDIDHSFAETIA